MENTKKMIQVTKEEENLIRLQAEKLIIEFLESDLEEDWFSIKVNDRFFDLNFFRDPICAEGLFGCSYHTESPYVYYCLFLDYKIADYIELEGEIDDE